MEWEIVEAKSGQGAVLEKVREVDKPVTYKEVAEMLGINHKAATRALNKLSNQELIKSEEVIRNGNKTRIYYTYK